MYVNGYVYVHVMLMFILRVCECLRPICVYVLSMCYLWLCVSICSCLVAVHGICMCMFMFGLC